MTGRLIRPSDAELCAYCEDHNPSGKDVKFYDNKYYLYGIPLSFWEKDRKSARDYAVREIKYQIETEITQGTGSSCLLTTKPNGGSPYITLTVTLDDKDLEQINLFLYRGDQIPF